MAAGLRVMCTSRAYSSDSSFFPYCQFVQMPSCNSVTLINRIGHMSILVRRWLSVTIIAFCQIIGLPSLRYNHWSLLCVARFSSLLPIFWLIPAVYSEDLSYFEKPDLLYTFPKPKDGLNSARCSWCTCSLTHPIRALYQYTPLYIMTNITTHLQ